MYDMVESIVGKMMLSSLFYTNMELTTKSMTIQPVCACGGPPKDICQRMSFTLEELVIQSSRQMKYSGLDPRGVGQQIW